MTIRYTCTECESVLKIKDEKAGTKGKCPKCKAEFLVPNPEREEVDNDLEAESHAPEEPADSVDMPIELTPDVAEPDNFDPLSGLGGSGSAGSARTSSSARSEAGERKPSMAEMMRDFEATKKKDREKRSHAEVSRPTSASGASTAMETAGTAADALSKAYQQKRESASAPTRNAKDIKAAEERALLSEFIMKKAGPGVLLVVGLLYGYFQWMNYEPYTGPPLFDVSGQVLKSGSPAAGVKICFEPIAKDLSDVRTVVWATSVEDGKFRLMYDASHFGAPAGNYNIGCMTESGTPIIIPEGALTLTVKENSPNEFKINL